MNRTAWIAGLLLVTCTVQSEPVVIGTHCGLSSTVVEWDGKDWTFNVEPTGNAPPGWDDPEDTIRIVDGANGPIAIGPDGVTYQLIEGHPPGADTCH